MIEKFWNKEQIELVSRFRRNFRAGKYLTLLNHPKDHRKGMYYVDYIGIFGCSIKANVFDETDIFKDRTIWLAFPWDLEYVREMR